MLLKDVIHYYLGAEFIVEYEEGIFKDKVNIISGDIGQDDIEVWGDETEAFPLSKIKLILRDISDMTEEEHVKYYSLCKNVIYENSKN